MNRVLNFAVVAMSAVIMTSSRVDAAVVNITEGSTSGYTMTDGNTYVIQNSVSFSNSTVGGSGMSVADNATVVLYVPAGITLTAIGAHGSGQIGGGAGILVPETAMLIITGEGTVKAMGGNAGNGGDGAAGSKGTEVVAAFSNTYWYFTGSSGLGGAGGVGGGGAGAAIGGSGGSGGYGGEAGQSVNRVKCGYYNAFCQSGNNGMPGYPGRGGIGMGVCYVLGRVNVTATAGSTGDAGSAGHHADMCDIVKQTQQGYIDQFTTCGGGGGGGGGAGCSPSKVIGGGGASGGGGGGGGSGATLGGTSYSDYPFVNAHGGGGIGGLSRVSGETGSAKGTTKAGGIFDRGYYYDGAYHSSYRGAEDYFGGDGGVGGDVGVEGGAGTLYVSPTATVNVEREILSATTHPAAQYVITFDANGGQFYSYNEALVATLGCGLPNCIPCPIREGYLFEGWMTIAGDLYYDASGAKSISAYPVAGDITLYAKWCFDDDYTTMTIEPVPHSYLNKNCSVILADHNNDYEAAANATAANGFNKVWECYVTGISPTNEAAKFSAKIEMKDGAPVVTWKPDLNTNGIVRIYKVYGSETLENGGDWQYPTNSFHKFFKVTVEMP